MKTRIVIAVLVLGAFGACKTTSSEKAPVATPTEGPSAAVEQAGTLEQGRDLTRGFYAGELGSIWERMTDQMHEGLGSEQNLAAFRQQVADQLGTETEVLDEQVASSPPYQVYIRTASFSTVDKPVIVQWALDPDGKIAGFFVRPVD